MGNPFIQLPEICIFEFNGEEKPYQLHWKNIAFDEIWHKLGTSTVIAKAEVLQFDKRAIWISLPTFAPDPQMSQDFKTIFSNLKKYRAFSKIVIDLRGNTGGSSSWGTEFLRSLYTPEFIEKIDQEITKDEVYEYRVTEKIIKYFSELLGDSSKNINKNNVFFTKIKSELQSALTQNLKSSRIVMRDFHRESSRSKENPVKAKVFVLTDEMCFSACLSLMDCLIHIPDTIHIGRPTSADTVFMQTTDDFYLLDGDLRLSVPVLRVHHRTRKNNEPYIPKHVYPNEISDTQKIQNWVRKF